MQKTPTLTNSEAINYYNSLDINDKESVLREAYELRMTFIEYIETVLYYDMLDNEL